MARVDGGGARGGDLSLSAAADAVERHGEMRSKEAALGRQLAAEQLEVQRHIWETVGDIAETMDDGSLIGGAVGDLLVEAGGGAAGETAGAVASEIPDTLGDILGTTAGQALGNAVSDLLPTGGSSVSITKPEWVPLGVARPEWEVGVERPSDLAVGRPEWKIGVREPDWAIGVEDVGPLAVDDPSPLRVETPVLEVEDTPPIEIDVSLSGTGGDLRATSSQGGKPTTQTENTGVPGPGLIESITDTASFGASQGASAGMGATPVGAAIGAVGGAGLGAAGGALGYGYRWGAHELNKLTRSSGDAAQNPSDVALEYGPTYNVNVDADRIIRELKQAHRRDINDLESRLNSVESDIDSLQRALRGR
ncbi:hypothetical protein ABY42_18850 (plasmid) [Haloferax gibbonsii]|uniref:Uncharacterized protein n=2 Tax=Haloferax gibbonsii TaxID=35746 RepID=A0A0K1IZL0_HALGI|nr:hypothetical protein ABY42_18850 [Haloferax gibbonsii]